MPMVQALLPQTPSANAPGGPETHDLSGMLIYTGTNMMPLVNEANPPMLLCAARHCMGRNCPGGTSGKMIHDLDID